jgi:hypothetical protein
VFGTNDAEMAAIKSENAPDIHAFSDGNQYTIYEINSVIGVLLQ